jgi:hypothetical protein
MLPDIHPIHKKNAQEDLPPSILNRNSYYKNDIHLQHLFLYDSRISVATKPLSWEGKAIRLISCDAAPKSPFLLFLLIAFLRCLASGIRPGLDRSVKRTCGYTPYGCADHVRRYVFVPVLTGISIDCGWSLCAKATGDNSFIDGSFAVVITSAIRQTIYAID